MERICPLPVRPTTPHSFMSIISPVPVPVPVCAPFLFFSFSFFSAIAGLLFSFFTPPRAMPCDSCCPALPCPGSWSPVARPPIRRLACRSLRFACHAPHRLSSARGSSRGCPTLLTLMTMITATMMVVPACWERTYGPAHAERSSVSLTTAMRTVRAPCDKAATTMRRLRCLRRPMASVKRSVHHPPLIITNLIPSHLASRQPLTIHRPTTSTTHGGSNRKTCLRSKQTTTWRRTVSSRQQTWKIA
ncbi:hypothetical protein HDK77DRAFT_511049 [Phyllosticta capitalensis]